MFSVSLVEFLSYSYIIYLYHTAIESKYFRHFFFQIFPSLDLCKINKHVKINKVISHVFPFLAHMTQLKVLNLAQLKNRLNLQKSTTVQNIRNSEFKSQLNENNKYEQSTRIAMKINRNKFFSPIIAKHLQFYRTKIWMLFVFIVSLIHWRTIKHMIEK